MNKDIKASVIFKILKIQELRVHKLTQACMIKTIKKTKKIQNNNHLIK